MYVPTPDLRISFDLNHTFSYFENRIPTTEELEHCNKIFITSNPTSWNSYSDHFSQNESAMIDCDGNIIPNKTGEIT